VDRADQGGRSRAKGGGSKEASACVHGIPAVNQMRDGDSVAQWTNVH
jgi:hypothetical protein